VLEVQFRDEAPVEVQLTVTVPERKWNQKYESRGSLREEITEEVVKLATENTDLNKLGRRDLTNSQFR
jgi:hypothetical protein